MTLGDKGADMPRARQRKQTKRNPAEQALQDGFALIRESPLFSLMDEGGGLEFVRTADNRELAASPAVVDYDGSNGDTWSWRCTAAIRVNKSLRLDPAEWAWVIAHCKLHLAFGHFDAEKMPGFTDAEGQWQVHCDPALWNLACDLAIAKFLADIKFGRPLCPDPTDIVRTQLADERKIYEYLRENPALVSPSGELGRISWGTAGQPGLMDMRGLDKPQFYDASKGQRNRFALRFAHALAHSVSAAVSEAGGRDPATLEKKTPAQKAAQWFINHYPLLGGLAAGFRLREDFATCAREDVSIAAVDVDQALILVNPACGLTEAELRFVLAHEYLHAGLQHHLRRRGRDHYLWNVACDYVINGWLVEMQVGDMPSRGLLYDPALKDRSAEQIYDTIAKDLRRLAKLSTFRGCGKGDILGEGWRQGGPAVTLDDFYRGALQNGLEYHSSSDRGLVPAGLAQEIRALAMPPIPWDVQLAEWFDLHFAPLEKRRSYARPSRRQGSTPDIPRPRYCPAEVPENSRTFGCVVDTSGSMSAKLIGHALGAIASFAAAKEVPYARVVFCDAQAYDAGWIAPEDIAGRIAVKGRGGTILQPGVDLLEQADDFPKDGPILIITDGFIEDELRIRRDHAFLLPQGRRLPFRPGPRGEVFFFAQERA